MAPTCLSAFYLTAAYDLLDGFYDGHLDAVYYLTPDHFNFLRVRMHFIRWETLLTAAMIPNIPPGELAFFDETFLNTTDPISIVENNALLRATLLRALQMIMHTHSTE